MFKSYYGFAKNPFDKQSLLEKEQFASCDHKEMFSRLQYLKEVRGIGLFTAGPGFGKTFTLRCFAKTLDRNLFQMIYLPKFPADILTYVTIERWIVEKTFNNN